MRHLQGVIPSQLDTLTNLVDLNLDDSSFTGCVPSETLARSMLKLTTISRTKVRLSAFGRSLTSLKRL
jgi:hypothetical protein